MNERCGLQSLARILQCELLRRQSAEFLIHQGQQLLCCGRVSRFDLTKDLCDVAHSSQYTGSDGPEHSAPHCDSGVQIPTRKLRPPTETRLVAVNRTHHDMPAANSRRSRLLGLTNVSLKCSNYPSDDGRFNGRTHGIRQVVMSSRWVIDDVAATG